MLRLKFDYENVKNNSKTYVIIIDLSSEVYRS